MTRPAGRHLPASIHRTTVNGCDVRYLRAGSGTAVVFVHTLRPQLDMFLRVIEDLPPALAEEIARCGRLPGHARAFRSLCLQWRSWLSARARYGQITLPVTLVYGDEDWSHPAERDANARAIPGARLVMLQAAGHFAGLDEPDQIAGLIHAVTWRGSDR